MGRGNLKCAAVTCNSRKVLNSDISFHAFPKDPERRWEWIVNFGRTDLLGAEETVFNNTFVCSDHFELHCFKSFLKRRLLSNAAVPTIFDHKIDESGVPRLVECMTRLHKEKVTRYIAENQFPQDEEKQAQNSKKSDVIRLYVCSICSETFPSVNNLLIHEYKAHTPVHQANPLQTCTNNIYACSTCNKSFALKSKLLNHEIMEHDGFSRKNREVTVPVIK